MLTRALLTVAMAGIAGGWLMSPARALDLNSLRAQHHLPALSVSATLAGAAYSHAHDLARRQHLDHNGFRARLSFVHSAAAENVAVIACARPDAKPGATFAGRACGCESEDCVFQMWAKSAGHRANMLRRDVTSYGLASATGGNGRRYWVLELGN